MGLLVILLSTAMKHVNDYEDIMASLSEHDITRYVQVCERLQVTRNVSLSAPHIFIPIPPFSVPFPSPLSPSLNFSPHQNNLLNSCRIKSTIWFCKTSVIATFSAGRSGDRSVGPNTIAMFCICIRFSREHSTTLLRWNKHIHCSCC